MLTQKARSARVITRRCYCSRMPRGPAPKYDHPELPAALHWLRRRASLTQGEVAERAQQSGQSLSEVYYRQCESGRKTPSNPTLAAILVALGSDFDELDGLLTYAPWESANRNEGPRLRRSTPKPALYSTPVTPAAKNLALGAPSTYESRTPPTPGSPSQSNLVSGEISELSDIYLNMSRGDQINTMAFVRSRDKRRTR